MPRLRLGRCPLCGSDDVRYTYDNWPTATCVACGCNVGGRDEDEVARKWNMRGGKDMTDEFVREWTHEWTNTTSR